MSFLPSLAEEEKRMTMPMAISRTYINPATNNWDPMACRSAHGRQAANTADIRATSEETTQTVLRCTHL